MIIYIGDDKFIKMNLPKFLPINREEDYHTHYLGTVADGRQFFGYSTFVFSQPKDTFDFDQWPNFRKEYTLLHTFDKGGNYLKTEHHYDGTTAECDVELQQERLEKMVNALGKIKFKNIAIKLFQTEIDGIVFGLIPNEEYELINLEPSATISFQEPWDGEYYT